jgi:hypothetical protein
MKNSQLRFDSSEVWYVLWSAMFLISSGNDLFPDSTFSYHSGFILSVLLIALAVVQLCRGLRTLSRRQTDLAATMLFVFTITQLIRWVRSLGPRYNYRGFDFSAYYLAAKVGSDTPGHSLYDLPFYPDGRMDLLSSAPIHSTWQRAALSYNVPFDAPFIYPPFFAVLMRPFAHLSFASAFTLWEMITILLLIGAVLLTFSVAGVRMDSKTALILGVGLFSYFPFRDGLFMGQISCLILFLIAAGVWLVSRDLTLLSALSFAAATMIKLTPVLALPLLIFHRRWRWLAAYATWMGVLLILSVTQAGWAAHEQFWKVVLPSISSGSPIYLNSSIAGYVQELFLGFVPDWGHRQPTLPLYACTTSRVVAIAVYSLMLVRFYLRRREGDLVRDLVIMALLGIVISPIGWWHHFTIALLPFLYFWCKMPDRGDPLLLALFLVVGTNLMGFGPLLTANHAVQLILAAIVPGLTIAGVYQCLSPRGDPSALSSTSEHLAAGMTNYVG